MKKTDTVQLIGRFYFKKTHNNNLIGEFSNNRDNNIYSESADRLQNISETTGYDGEYETTWRQSEGSFFFVLIIKIKPNTNGRIFELKWFNNENTIFVGEGFLCDDILIGDYREITS